MKMNSPGLPDNVREYLVSLGYRQFQVEYVDFGGIILYLRKERGGQEAAYYLSKPSSIELVTSDELRRVLDLLEDSGIPLRHVVTTSPCSAGSHKLAEENGVNLRQLPVVEISQSFEDDARVKRQAFRPGVSFVTRAPVNPNDSLPHRDDL